MSNQYLKLRRSSVPNKIPDTGSLDFGELALNTYDGLVFMKKSGSSGEEVISIGSGGGGGTTNTGSFATTGSNRFIGNQIITGSLNNGLNNIAIGQYSHAEGAYTTAVGDNSHAEGYSTISSGSYSHAEGSITKATGDYSHAEGDNTQAIGNYSHAEGQDTTALGQYSHVEGWNTITSANHQHVQGQWNVTSSVPAAFIVGNGTDDGNRSNLIYAHDSIVEITGSLSVTNGITGSLFGTASWSLNTLNPFTFIATGSVTASVNIANDIFLIKSASVNFLTITNNTTTIQNDIFLIKDLSNRTVFTVSQSIVYFPTQSATLSNSLASAGGIYFTSSSFYVGLEE